MYKPDDFSPDHEKRRGRRLAAIAGLGVLFFAAGILVQLPLGAKAGIATDAGVRNASRLPPLTAPPNQKASGPYQLRCWQYGQLLFEEGPVTLAAEARRGARLVAIDPHGGTLIVTDAGETTCLARPFGAAPNLALPH